MKIQNCALLCLTIVATIVESKVLWDGSATRGTKAVWKLLNFEGSGNTVDVVDDPTYGKVWRFHKPKGSHRSEGHGANGFQAKEGDDLYIGWVLKLHQPEILDTFANFQWKSFGENMTQNHPVMLRTMKGHLNLEQWNPGPHNTMSDRIHTQLWETNVKSIEDHWHTIVLRIHVSKDIHKGFVEFWYDGKQQKLHDSGNRYVCRTFDGDHVDPKWGVYGGDDGDATTYVGRIKIASTYEDADPSGN